MSFSSEIKKEITQNELHECCSKAQLAAIVQICSTLSMTSEGMKLNIQSDNASIAKRIFQLLKDNYHVETQISVIKKMNLKKNNTYVVKALHKAKDILLDLGILDDQGLQFTPRSDLFESDCCKRAFLAGAFLGSGSCNSPHTSNYHLEISCNSNELAIFICDMMNEYELNAKVTKRRNHFITYLKASDKIADFIRFVGAPSCLFAFEDSRIQRDFMNNFSRLDNCELANEMKIIKTGKEQLEDIQRIENYVGLDILSPKLLEVAMLRKEFPEASFNELCEEFEIKYGNTISKSGLRHRFSKIKEVAKTYKMRKELTK